ncbi:MAG: MFS transporter [Clostridiales bacterium]|nr:MFS transporter [Clostridiales bacterium]MCF8023027.1 MFS transporter [Clostridiales bacterium]
MHPVHLMLPGFLMVTSTYGLARYTYGAFLPQIKADFALGHILCGLVGSLPHLSYLIATFLAIWLADHKGLKHPVFLGGAIAVTGLLLVSVSTKLWILSIGIITGGMSGGFVWTVMPKIITKLIAVSEQDRVISFMNAGPTLAVFLTGPLAFWLGNDWKFIWGIFCIIALFSYLWMIKVLAPAYISLETTRSVSKISIQALLKPGKYFFTASFIFGLGTGTFFTYAVELIQNINGDSLIWNKFIMSFVGLGGISTMLTAYVLKKLTIKFLYNVVSLLLSLSVLLLPFSCSILSQGVTAVVFGISFYSFSALLVIWGIHLFKEHQAEANGIMLFLLALGQFLSPISIGYLLNYFSLHYLFVGSGLLLGLLLLFQPYHEHRAKRITYKSVDSRWSGLPQPDTYSVLKGDRKLAKR